VGLHASRTARLQALGALIAPLPRLLQPALSLALPGDIAAFMGALPRFRVGIAAGSPLSADNLRRTLGRAPLETVLAHDIDGVLDFLVGSEHVALLLVDAGLPGFADFEVPPDPACGVVVVGSGGDEEWFQRRFGGSSCYGFVRSPFLVSDLLRVAATTARAVIESP